MMQKNIYCALVLMTVLFVSCSSLKKTSKSSDYMPGTWQATPIVVDGDSKDWPSPYPNYDSKSKVAYATSNDNKFLYITMEAGDELTQLKILKAGMTVSVDTGGKRNLVFNINYPLENDNINVDLSGGTDKPQAATAIERQFKEQLRKGVEQANQYSIMGFIGCSGGYTVTQVTPCGIKLKIRIDEYKQLVWEAAIPVKALYNKDSLSVGDEGKPISVCYSVKGLIPPKSGNTENANNNMNAAMGTGGAANMGRSNVQRRTPQDNPLEHLYNNTKTWKQFKLVTHP